MKTNSFNDVTIIVNALNRFTGLKNLTDSDTRSCTLINYSYKIFVVACTAFGIYYSNLFISVTLKINLKAMVYVLMGAACFFSLTCITIMSWYHSQEFLMLKRRIAVLEESLTKLGVVIDHRNILIWIIGMNIATVLNSLTIVGHYAMLIRKDFFRMLLSQFIYNYMLNLGGLVILDFMTCVWWLKFGFKQTNDLLKKFLVDGRQIKIRELDNEIAENKPARIFQTQRYLNKWISKYSTRRTRIVPVDNIPPMKHELQAVKRVQMIQEIRFIHLQLCRIMKLVNSAFSMQLMVHTIVIVMYIILVLYYLYTKLAGLNSNSLNGTYLLVWLFDALYTWSKIILVAYICEHAAKEARKVVVIIHECSVYDIDTELKDEISQFSLQISLSQVGDSKCNLLPMNFPLIRQWLGSMTTYLVIMIQWTQSAMADEPGLQNVTNPYV